MVIVQKFNKKTKAWVKFKITNRGSKITDVKQRNPRIAFKGVRKV